MSFAALPLNTYLRKLLLLLLLQVSPGLSDLRTLQENDRPEAARWSTPEQNAFLSFQNCLDFRKEGQPSQVGLACRGGVTLLLGLMSRLPPGGVSTGPGGLVCLLPLSLSTVSCHLSAPTYVLMVSKPKL